MTYCLSDIHGRSERFHQMLKAISFSDEDRMYIIGDVIDRGPDGIPLLQEIRRRPNMVLLKGNHEQMCLDTLGPQPQFGARQMWQRNGGGRTRSTMLYQMDPRERGEILRYLASLPEILPLIVDGRRYCLVHACPGHTREERLWTRPENFDWSVVPADVTCLIGHTPTCFLTGNMQEVMHIYHGEKYICLDCGCASVSPCSRLACLRLEDHQELYV